MMLLQGDTVATAMVNFVLDELQPLLWTHKKDALATFEEYFFRTKPKLTQADIQTLLVGETAGAQRKGLMLIAGQVSWKNNRLHNASILCLHLILRLMDTTQNPGVYVCQNEKVVSVCRC
jgi:hypothetical protein